MRRATSAFVLLALLAPVFPFLVKAEDTLPVDTPIETPSEDQASETPFEEFFAEEESKEIILSSAVVESLDQEPETTVSLYEESFPVLFEGIGQTLGDSVSDHMASEEWYLGQTGIQFTSPGRAKYIVIFPDLNDPDFINCVDTVWGPGTLNVWLGRGTTPAEAMVHHFTPTEREPREDGGCVYEHEGGVFVYPGTDFQFLLNSGYGPAIEFDYLGSDEPVESHHGRAQISDSGKAAPLLVWKQDSETITSLKYLISLGEEPPPVFGIPLDTEYVFSGPGITQEELSSFVVLAEALPAEITDLNYPLSYGAFNTPEYFKQNGTLVYVRAKLGHYHDSPDARVYFTIDRRDCRTPEKRLFEWGIPSGVRGTLVKEVILGPFSGTECVFTPIDETNGPQTAFEIRTMVNDVRSDMSSSAKDRLIDITLYSNERAAPRVSNVLFLPGFLGSRLYTDEDGKKRKLWEPNGADDIRDLAMNADGTSKLPVFVGDIVDQVTIDTGAGSLGLGTVYGEIMEYLNGIDIEEWKGYPYDWRYDVFDVIRDGSLREDDSRDYLLPLVEELANGSRTGKVTIIGHSNGGLLAKALMIELEKTGKANLVDDLILIGSPQAGTPKGMLGLLHGYDIVKPIIALDGTARASAITMPGAYGLFPSSAYFSLVETPVATFETGEETDLYRDVLGETITSYLEIFSFAVNDPFTRNTPATLDEETPFPLSRNLLEKSRETHELLDVWHAPEGVQVHEIAGWGNPTIVSAKYYTEKSFTCPTGLFSCGWNSSVDFVPQFVFDGDDTVLAPSAGLMGVGVYFDLDSLLDARAENRGHQDITESEMLHEYVSFLLALTDSYNTALFVSNEPNSTESGLVISVHSPVLLSIEDSRGNTSGIYPLSGSDLYYVQENIPGSSVEFGAEGKYVFLPEDEEYEIHVTGIGDGTFSLKLHEVGGDQTVFRGAVSGLPSNNQMTAEMQVAGDLSFISPIQVDENGDGLTDITESFLTGETVFVNGPLDTNPSSPSSSTRGSVRTIEASRGTVLGTTTIPIAVSIATEESSTPSETKSSSEESADLEIEPLHQAKHPIKEAAPRILDLIFSLFSVFAQWIAGLFGGKQAYTY